MTVITVDHWFGNRRRKASSEWELFNTFPRYSPTHGCSQNKASQTHTVMLLLKEIQLNGASTFMTLNQ